MALLVASMAFVTLLLISMTILSVTAGSPETAEQKRLLRYIRQLDSPDAGSGAVTGGFVAIRRAVERFFARLLKGRISESWLASELESGDIPLKASEFASINACFACAAGLVARVSGGNAVRVIAALAVGTLSPLLYVHLRKARRISRFGAQLPDALVLISGSLRAGHSFLQALEVAAREAPQPASKEFSRVLKELSLGAPFEDALTNFGRRVDSEDLELVITAVLIQRQVGGNLAELLDTVAETIRERVRIQGEIRTLTAQGRVSGAVISLLPIGLAAVMSVLNPGYLGLLVSHPLGRAALGLSGCGMLVGVWLVNRIARIEV